MVFQGTFEKRCLMVEVPTELSILTTSLSVLFILTNIPGNILLIFAVVLDPNKNLRTPFNWLVLNLASADLIVGLVTLPINVYIHIKEAMKIGITMEEKMAIQMSYFISCTASVLSLSSLAVERYLAVRKPNKYRLRVTNKRVICTVAGIWSMSLGLSSIYFKVGITKYRFIFNNASVVVATIIISVTYSFMLRKIRETPRNFINNGEKAASYATTSTSTKEQNEFSLDQNPSSLVRRRPTPINNNSHLLQEKVTKMFMVVLLALLSCYGPSTIMVYMITLCKTCSCTTLNWLREFHFMFVLMNSSVNFFCYAFQSPRFRGAFKKLLKVQPDAKDVIQFGNVNMAHSSSALNLNTEETNVRAQTVVSANKQLDTAL